MNWKAGLKFLVVLALIYAYAVQPRLTVFMVEEALTVMLGIAGLLIPAFLTAIVFLLLWQVASLVFLCLKWLLRPISGARRRPLHTGHVMSNPFPGH